jgi:hypothetical protein
MKKILLMGLCFLGIQLFVQGQVTIQSDLAWLDESGKVIEAHGGCIIKSAGVYYWYGEDRSDNQSSQKINCYSSKDLKHWKFENVILSSSSPGMAEVNLERPKVIYNDKTKKYVLWVHKENIHDYGEAKALIAECDSPTGDFKFVKEFRPFGNMSRDCTLFKDDDGTAYFISSANENADLVGYKLTPDYLDVASEKMIIKGGKREAPVIFKHKGTYYLCTSSTSGWGPNYNTVQSSKNIFGPYGSAKGLYGNDTWNSYVSQTAYALNINGNWMMMADRWKGWKLSDSRYMWLPIRFDKNGKLLPIEWADQWTINPASGDISAPLPFEPAKNNIALHKSTNASVANKMNGNEARCAFDNDPKTRWCANDGYWPHWLMVDLGDTETITSSQIIWERSNGTIYQYIIEASNDQKNWVKVLDKSENRDDHQMQNDQLQAKGRFFRLRVLNHIDPKGSYAWVSLFEWKLMHGQNNVALNKKATADSQQDGTYSGKANDGDFNTTWSTGSPTLGNWWSVDLGSFHDLTGCRIMWQDPGFYYQYKIEVSADSINWNVVVNSKDQKVIWVPTHTFDAKHVRYVRVTSTGLDDGCWLGIREFELFENKKLPMSQAFVDILGGKK